MIHHNLSFAQLLHVARNYLGEITYAGTQIEKVPMELKPFLDSTNSIVLKQQDSGHILDLHQTQKRALFLDRDGIINVDHGYVGKVSQVDLMPGIARLISKANHANYDVNIVTNQSGIGRGYYSEQDYLDVMDCIRKLLAQEQARIDHIKFAPYHPDSKDPKYHIGRHMRKPRPGMILQLQKEFQYDLQNSIMIGDRASDLMAGMVAGIGRIYLFESEQSKEEWQIFKNWLQALKPYGLANDFDHIQVRQLADFSEIQL